MSEEFSRSLLKIVVAQIVQGLGYNAIHQSACESTDLAAYSKAIYDYTRSLWDQARRTAESRAKENATTVRKPKHSPIRNNAERK